MHLPHIKNSEELHNAIYELELKQKYEEEMIKRQVGMVFESLNPINIIKNTLTPASDSEDIKENIITTSVGFAIGYLSKLLVENNSQHPIKKLIGTAVMFGINSIVSKNMGTLKLLGNGLFKLLERTKK